MIACPTKGILWVRAVVRPGVGNAGQRDRVFTFMVLFAINVIRDRRSVKSSSTGFVM